MPREPMEQESTHEMHEQNDSQEQQEGMVYPPRTHYRQQLNSTYPEETRNLLNYAYNLVDQNYPEVPYQELRGLERALFEQIQSGECSSEAKVDDVFNQYARQNQPAPRM